MDTHAYPLRADQVAWQVFGDEALLDAPGESAPFSLNRVGLFLWEHCDGRHNFEELVVLLMAYFEVDEGTAQIDVQEFLDELEASGLLFIHPRQEGA